MKKIYILFLAMLLLFWSCKDPFKPRAPKDPTGDGGSDYYELPTDPSLVMMNLLNSYNYKDIANFSSCLADSFRFRAATEDSATFPDEFDDWDYDKEIIATGTIFSQDSVFLQLAFTAEYSDNEDLLEGEARYYREYTLIVSSSQYATTQYPAEGIACFDMAMNSEGNWYIYRWQDIADASAGRWGQVKAEFGG